MSGEEVYPDEISKCLSEYQFISNQFACSGDFERAIETLSHSQELIKAVSSQGGSIAYQLVICTLHNLAFCHSQYFLFSIGNREESVNYLKRSISTYDKFSLLHGDTTKPKYKSRTFLSLYSILADLKRHENALDCARRGISSIFELLNLCISSCRKHNSRHLQFKNSKELQKRIKSHRQYKLLESPHYLHHHELVAKALPILEYLKSLMKNTKPKELNLRSLLGTDTTSVELALEHMNGLSWIDYEDLEPSPIQEELTRDSILKKSLLCTMGLYQIARALDHKGSIFKTPELLKEALDNHTQSLRLAHSLLHPRNSLLKAIQVSFDQSYPRKRGPKKKRLTKRARTPHLGPPKTSQPSPNSFIQPSYSK